MAVIYAVAYLAFCAFCDDNESLELSTWIAGKVIAAVVMALCVVALKKWMNPNISKQKNNQ